MLPKTDAWSWTVEYEDGTVVGDLLGWSVVNLNRVRRINLHYPTRVEPVMHALIPPGARPIMRRRRSITMHADGTGQTHSTLTIIGWDRGDGTAGEFFSVTDDGQVRAFTRLGKG